MFVLIIGVFSMNVPCRVYALSLIWKKKKKKKTLGTF